MKEIAITNEKQIIAGIKKDAGNFTDCANKAIHYAISAGEKLIELKKITKHGEWENRLKNDFHDVFGVRQLQRFMEIAESKYLAIGLNSDKTLTLEQTIKAISDATPEQLEIAKQLQEVEELRRINAESEKQAKAEAKKQPEIIDGEFTEVKAPEPSIEVEKINTPEPELKKPAPEAEHHEDDPKVLLMEIIDNQEILIKELQSENLSLVKVFESNDQLTQALEELKKAKAISKGYEDRMIGLQNERAQLMQAAKYWQKRAEKAEKSNVTTA